LGFVAGDMNSITHSEGNMLEYISLPTTQFEPFLLDADCQSCTQIYSANPPTMLQDRFTGMCEMTRKIISKLDKPEKKGEKLSEIVKVRMYQLLGFVLHDISCNPVGITRLLHVPFILVRVA
jgi:hypothetical protein